MENNDDDPGGFRACLGIKLARTSTGAEVFVALKGAVDVGLNIPYSEMRFPGYDSKAKSLKADGFRADILRQYMADYMRNLSEEDEETYKKQFSRYTKLGVTPDSVKGLYTKAHADIRDDQSDKAKADKKVTKRKWTAARNDLEARKAKVAVAKKKKMKSAAGSKKVVKKNAKKVGKKLSGTIQKRKGIMLMKKSVKKTNRRRWTTAKISLETRKAKVAVTKYPERNVVKFLKKPATKIPRQTLVQVPKTDVHRYCETISNIFPSC